MSNVVITHDQYGIEFPRDTGLYELDEVPGISVTYRGSPQERRSFLSRSCPHSSVIYGTKGEDSLLSAVAHKKESPYGAGLYFNAYAKNTGTGDPKIERTIKYDPISDFTTVTNRVVSGHFEHFYPGTDGCYSCYVGPTLIEYWADYDDFRPLPTASVRVSTIYKGHVVSGTATRKNFPHLSYESVRSGDLEGFLQSELSAAEAQLTENISRVTTDGGMGSPTEMQFSAPKFNFKLNEYYNYEVIRDLDLIPTQLRWIAGNAYINACQNLPKTANNTLQNVLEVIELIRSIKSGNLGKAATSFVNASAYEGAKSAWLMYRYQYNTTKMDFEEYKDLVYRLKDLQQMSKITIRGEFAWGGYQCRCSFDVNACDFIPHTLNEFLRASGLYFKTADIWDDIPFSFIVDWFLHLGDALTWLDTHEDAWNVRPSNVWYSWETSYDGQTCYIRAPGEPIVNAPYLATNTGSSAKVKAMRFADVISIFL